MDPEMALHGLLVSILGDLLQTVVIRKQFQNFFREAVQIGEVEQEDIFPSANSSSRRTLLSDNTAVWQSMALRTRSVRPSLVPWHNVEREFGALCNEQSFWRVQCRMPNQAGMFWKGRVVPTVAIYVYFYPGLKNGMYYFFHGNKT